MSSSEYNKQVSDWLKEIQPGWRIVGDICKPENLEIFIAAVKAYIDADGYDIYFSSDYKKLRKITIPEDFLTKTTEK